MKIIPLIFCFIVTYTSLSQTAKITTHDYQEISASKHYIVAIKYPEVDFGPEALMGVRGIASDINFGIDTLKENLLKDFRAELKNNPPDAPCSKNNSGLYVEYKTVYNNNSLFSFSFETNSTPGCANHPYNYVTTFNYSALSVGTFGFSDIFLKDKPYLKFISDFCRNELKERAKKEGLENVNENIDEGTAPDAYKFRVFNVTQTELIITFNPYWVGPWILGIQKVTIPYSKIKDLIDPQGPVGEFIK
jgi:hypothetical protein